MKKLIFMGILGLFALGACNNKNTQGHEGHGHSTVTHNNDEHNHEAEGHDHEAEGHTHGTEGECNGDHKHDAADNHQGTAAGHDETAEAAHSDEIILPKAKADAAGVKVSIVEPAPFQQVIKTSGQVLAAQGDESVAVATVQVLSHREGDGRYECRQRHSASDHFLAQHRRRRPGATCPHRLRSVEERIRTNESACQKQNRIRQGFCTGRAELRECPHQL